MDCSPPGSSVHGTLQARIIEWVAIPFSRGSSQPRGRTQVFCIAGRHFIFWATREALIDHKVVFKCKIGSILEVDLQLISYENANRADIVNECELAAYYKSEAILE